MKQFKTIGPPIYVTKTTAHITLTLGQWHDCRWETDYDRIIAEEVQKQLGWTGKFLKHSEFMYLENNQGVRLTVTYEREGPRES